MLGTPFSAGSVASRRKKKGTSSLKKLKKGTLNLTSSYVNSLFTIVLTKQIFEEDGLSFSLKQPLAEDFGAGPQKELIVNFEDYLFIM